MTLSLDFTNCLSEAIGATHGLTKSEVETLVAKFPKHHESIEEMRSNGESGFFELPYQDYDEVSTIDRLIDIDSVWRKCEEFGSVFNSLPPL